MSFCEKEGSTRSSSPVDDGNFPCTSSQPDGISSQAAAAARRSGVNVYRLLAKREICPRTKHSAKKVWGEISDCNNIREISDAKLGLISWVESESLRHLSAKYCPLVPPPRSTIAAAFSPDGKTLASTHGDHTVKIIDCQSGSCLKVLSGHRRTPWVVRFHPVHPEILASGSLDYEVRLWDANTAECIGSRDFYRPIASIAFHAQGEVLAVASGHKLYIWHYNRREETSSPAIVLKTRRSLRAVHFHPHAAPYLLTAEVNDLDSPDSPMTLATSPGYLHYPPPAVFFANVHSGVLPNIPRATPMPFPFLFWPTFARDGGQSLPHAFMAAGSSSSSQTVQPSARAQLQTDPSIGSQLDYLVSPMDSAPVIPSTPFPVPETVNNNFLSETENAVCDSAMDIMDTTEGQPIGRDYDSRSPMLDTPDGVRNTPALSFQPSGVGRTHSRQVRSGVEATPSIYLSTFSGNPALQMLLRGGESSQLHQFFPFGDPMFWELPFLQGWLMGQSQAGLHPMLSLNDALHEGAPGFRGGGSDILASDLASRSMDTSVASSIMTNGVGQSRMVGRSGLRYRSSRTRAMARPGEGAGFINIMHDESDTQPIIGRTESELATSLAAAAAAELPCTVKLRVWPHDIKDPCAPLDAEKCRLTIPHAVLCSEMGAHFSPCGRFLAACVACMLPHMEAEPGLQSQAHHDVTGASTSPTRHPISAHQVMYELRIYSLEEATFGLVLASRAIRAAHCLTSIQFSPTSEHILLAYGRRHSSLLRSIVIDGETTVPIYTILEVYRVSDMELVRVLPSAEDEVNVACFHPLVGGGLVYGTKEGKLRILQYDGSHGTNCAGANLNLEENMLEVPTYALEG
ncbi:Activating molecule in becn1-regulated autophagy protein [Thalictrum thalictroides]|uniref:Activating molecule in becn1-regulated autophagy protein n=1 Tax=Thalictrum thalictroides TaxID=46969 RepID=A0A7J6V4F7_THATH|nr:Activating molecule in becn1-regulated autophagy protein [Thalictrum thalictroides]